MNNFEKINYVRKLEAQKAKLEKDLAIINESINQQKDSCSHILVNLGFKGVFSDDYERCLLCGQQAEEGYALASEYHIHAEDYLLNYNVNDEKQCEEKFDNIQTLALGLLSENPNMSTEELVDKLNNLIQEGISLRENQNGAKLVKMPKNIQEN